ncbi:CPBP family intramembrane metalloprotease [Salipaludibacillus keqinensis]|uniref:CPBP family intramembrane metalloprotease n=1 Tax=Salipaludibacillus keqinensis TaxID=2045207 RepID=A0A323TY69_9BACI|nr:type II CAAX endopeptidase family protein [Salipaludibacillus keqinensis]PYZ94475.1 CPBP family intramembrane metalloprotease [Salipaludibacillus keqinensis]
MSRQGDLIKELSDKELLLNLYMTQLIILAVALLIGLLTGNIFQPFTYITFRVDHLFIGLAFGVGVVLMEWLLHIFVPKKWFNDGGINERIFSNRHPIHIAFLSFVVAICEEILFRGVLQSQYGIWIASLLFALIHFRYLSNLFLFFLAIGLSFSLGWLFILTENLLTVIVAHFIIDFLLGLLIRFQKINEVR